jgi:predicted TPR repeat methyltransferase
MSDTDGGEETQSPTVPDVAVARTAEAVTAPELRPIVARYLAGEVDAEVALTQMVVAGTDAAVVRRAVDEVTAEADAHSRATDAILRDRVDALTRLVLEREGDYARIAQLLRSELEHAHPAPSVEERLARVEQLFDWSARGGAGAALDSLGDPAPLALATAEVVAQFDRWGLLGPDRRVLQLGCGTGRIEQALAPRVGEAHGVDVSEEMVRAARRRCAALPNVVIARSSGRDLGMYPDERFDLVYALDSFPYLGQVGAAVVDRHVAESGRVLRAGGELVIVNFSYGGDAAADRAAVRAHAAAHGLTVVLDGERALERWEGAVWRLQKPQRARPA